MIRRFVLKEIYSLVGPTVGVHHCLGRNGGKHWAVAARLFEPIIDWEDIFYKKEVYIYPLTFSKNKHPSPYKKKKTTI